MQDKQCKTCLDFKSLDEFAKCKECKDGVRGDCKKCHSKKSVLYQQENADKRAIYNKKWHLQNKDKVKKSQDAYKDIKNKACREKYANDENVRNAAKKQAKEWQENNPLMRKSQRLKQYGITLEQYNLMLEDSNHSCRICGYSNMDDKKMFPVIDHCHNSLKVRGILCSNCNLALGKFKDDTLLLENAIYYLKENG